MKDDLEILLKKLKRRLLTFKTYLILWLNSFPPSKDAAHVVLFLSCTNYNSTESLLLLFNWHATKLSLSYYLVISTFSSNKVFELLILQI